MYIEVYVSSFDCNRDGRGYGFHWGMWYFHFLYLVNKTESGIEFRHLIRFVLTECFNTKFPVLAL